MKVTFQRHWKSFVTKEHLISIVSHVIVNRYIIGPQGAMHGLFSFQGNSVTFERLDTVVSLLNFEDFPWRNLKHCVFHFLCFLTQDKEASSDAYSCFKASDHKVTSSVIMTQSLENSNSKNKMKAFIWIKSPRLMKCIITLIVWKSLICVFHKSILSKYNI